MCHPLTIPFTCTDTMIGPTLVRFLLVTVLVGLSIFWGYNLFGAQHMSGEQQTATPALQEREAGTVKMGPLTGEAKVITEILKNADQLGLKVMLPPSAVKQPDSSTNPPPAHPNAPAEKSLQERIEKPKPSKPITVPVPAPETKQQVATSSVAASTASRMLSYQECQASYGKAAYLPKDKRRKPAVLYTFPGSGNTWARLLIDKASGIYSGSVYNDRSLVPVLPGEITCDWSVSVVKAHPHTHAAFALLNGGFHSDGKMKCTRGNIRTFDKAVLLIRDPYDSIWSEYQRRVSDSHVSGIPRSEFDMVQWIANACNLANRYNEMWSSHYMLLEEKLSDKGVLYVKYEDLRDESRRVDTLRRIMTFTGFPDVSDERINCAFSLANSRHVKRTTDGNHIGKKELYGENKDLVCKMWATFGMYAQKHGYRPWGGHTCPDGESEKLVDMNVGPKGSLNRQWMSKRQIDVLKMKEGFAPTGILLGPLGGRVKGKRAGGVRANTLVAQQEPVKMPISKGLVGLGTLGKDKPAWAD